MAKESGRGEKVLTWTQTLTKVKRDLVAVKLSTARGMPTLLATLEIPTSFQQQRGKLGSLIHKGILEKLALVGLKSYFHF